MKRFLIIIAIVGLIFISSCKKDETETTDTPDTPIHECTHLEWVFPEGTKCHERAAAEYTCIECGKVFAREERLKEHEILEEEVAPKCEEDGYHREYCKNCDYESRFRLAATGHLHGHYEIDLKATATSTGRRHKVCDDCGAVFKSIEYAANGFSDHGKLSVNGTDLVDANGDPFQLVGISTHGLQWFAQYVKYNVIEELRNEFGINVLRIALYSAEGGYCDPNTSAERKQFFYDTVCNGVEIATALDMYCIVDWHMLGADDPSDGNPLYYKEEAKAFFTSITEKYKDYDNVLYEIMNEPCGDTTWTQCKIYANQIIPIIRANTDAIVLVGNPHWSADLASVINSPLEGYENIMYTFHFYANGSSNPEPLRRAHKANIPVFVSEHGAMESTGDGPLDITKLLGMYSVMEEYNLSYVAWNLSNSKGSASIHKNATSVIDDFSDSNLKEWGIWYKKWVRKKFGLTVEED